MTKESNTSPVHRPFLSTEQMKKVVEAARKATRPFRILAICNQLIPCLTTESRKVGWAISRHGSMTRDLDLVAVPWTDDAVSSDVFVELMRQAVEKAIGGKAFAGQPETKPHGRLAVIITSTSEALVEDETGAHPYVDLSIVDTRISA